MANSVLRTAAYGLSVVMVAVAIYYAAVTGFAGTGSPPTELAPLSPASPPNASPIATADSVRESATPAPSGERSQPDHGSIQLVEVDTGDPGLGIAVRLRTLAGDGQRTFERVAVDSGLIPVPPGEYEVEATSRDWRVLRPRCLIAAGETATCWVTHCVPNTVEVRRVGGGQVEGAAVTWSTLLGQESTEPVGEELGSAITSADGVARIEGVPGTSVGVRVGCSGYRGANLRFARLPNPVVVYLAPMEEAVTLHVTDARTGRPVAGAACATASRRVELITLVAGSYRAALADLATPATVSAPGYLATWIPAIDTSSRQEVQVALEPLFRLVISNPSDHACATFLDVACKSGSATSSTSDFYLAARSHRVVLLPADATVTVHGVAADGQVDSGRQAHMGDAEAVFDLRFEEPSMPLMMNVGQTSGKPLSARLRAYYRSGVCLDVAGRASGEFSVGLNKYLRYVSVTCDDHESVSVMPVPAHEGNVASLAGTVSVQLSESLRCEIALVSKSGLPAPCAEIAVSGLDGAKAMESFPDLRGNWPSSHRAWSIQRQPLRTRSIGLRGAAVLDLSPGDYVVSACLPEELSGAASSVPLHLEPARITIGRSGRYEVVAEPMRCVAVAVNGPGGEPVGRFVATGDVFGAASGVVCSEQWASLWVAAGEASVRVSAPGFLPQVVKVPQHVQQVAVCLAPSAATTATGRLSVSGPPGIVAGAKVVLSARRQGGSQQDPVWRAELRLSDAGTADFSVDLEGPLRMSLMFQRGGLRVEEVQTTWVANGVVEFLVVEK